MAIWLKALQRPAVLSTMSTMLGFGFGAADDDDVDADFLSRFDVGVADVVVVVVADIFFFSRTYRMVLVATWCRNRIKITLNILVES